MSHRETLLRRKVTLQAEIDSIKDQIATAKSNAAATGEYADREWFLAANRALKGKARQMQILQIQIGDASRAERQQRNATLDRAFVEVAKALLPRETFQQIAAVANATGSAS